MTRDECVAAADAAAALVWGASGGPDAFRWYDALRFSPVILAQYVGANRGANAMALYRFCVAGEPGAASWTRLPPPQRVALEVFRATWLTLLFEMEEARERAKLRVASLRSDALEAHRLAVTSTPIRIAQLPPAVLPSAAAVIDAEIAKLEQQWAGDDGRPKRAGAGRHLKRNQGGGKAP